MSRIVWLASYPKSGNTWFRALLANLDRERSDPVSIEALGAPNAAGRAAFDRAAGIDSADLTAAEADRLRPQVYWRLAATARGAEPVFLKIHDAFLAPGDGAPLVPTEASRGAIYLVRNPLDVCISFAHHSGWTFDTAIARMADGDYAMARRRDRLDHQLRQHLSSWSGHVRSWLDNGRMPVHLVRYEDLQAQPVATLAAAIAFAGLERSRAEVERAVEWSRFDRLQAQERSGGFSEKPMRMPGFFRSGRAGGWKEELTAAQVDRIRGDHAAVMRRLGYLDGVSP